MMQEKDIKILFDAGALSRVSVIHMPVLAGFTYQFYYKEKKIRRRQCNNKPID